MGTKSKLTVSHGAIISDAGKRAADARGIIPDHPLADVLGTMDSEYMDELRQEIRKYKREVDRRESEQK
jgi:hypothetical protein